MRGFLPPVVSKFASFLPLPPLAFASRELIRRALAVRPSFVARLAEYAGRVFAIDPADCPFAFLVTARSGDAEVEMVRSLEGAHYDARIRAPLIVLMGMVDGTYDGDALFFSRDLAIAGDTEAVLALRNALENAELDPATVIGLPEAVRGPANRAAELVFGELRRLLDAPEASGPKAAWSGGVHPA
jgi:O2-independent ubiquinone biosynthesis accessory factor UbiT